MDVSTVPFERALVQVRGSLKEKTKRKYQEKGERHTVPIFSGHLEPGPHYWSETLMNAGESSEMSTNHIEIQTQLDQLLEEVKTCRPDNEIPEPQTQQRKLPKKKTIKQLFTVASKFQRNLRRGIYLACVLYHEDRVLVTNEDFLPVIEIDETFPSSINADLHWLIKVSCTWNESKFIRYEMEKNVSSTVHFRTKILSAVIQMQTSLGIQDLGQIFYKPLKDSRGTMVLSTVNYVKFPKSVSLLNSKWSPASKVLRKIILSDDLNLTEILMASIQHQINYHQVSSLKLGRGLYLAYLKMQSSVESIKVVTSLKAPNMLPHCKIRDNPHITHEEWSYLKRNYSLEIADTGNEVQKTFLELVASACKRLFNYMDISNEDTINHRIYDSEIIFLTKDVSFIVLCPSAELSCSIPAKREMLLQRSDLLSLPIQVFEMIHLNTYKTAITKKYSKLSCILEIDTITANHLHREAFSNSEVIVAKERVLKLQEFEQRLNSIWKNVRWLMNVICFARDRAASGISIRCILQRVSQPFGMLPQTLLLPPEEQLPLNKSFGRGSWPGPGNMVTSDTHVSEFSRSEQNLKSKEYTNHINAYEPETRKSKLPTSKSESILMRISNKCNPQRTRSNTICDITSANNPNKIVMSNSASVNSDLPESSNDPQSILPHVKRKKSKIVSSKSMTNVKQTLKFNKFKSNSNHPDTVSILSKSLNNINTEPEINGEVHEELENKKVSKSSRTLRAPFGYKNESGILQVFAAYETGLASGTSLKLHVTPRTTAREVVDLVIKQLNMAVVLKGKEGPVYNPDKLNNFCLVAVIGARERCLRDDFKPLLLQNPWRKGRLYVRQKQDVLAALEHSSRHSTII